MERTYRRLEAVLIAHLAIDPERYSTFRSRIKQLQRLNFPSGVNIGRGEKMVYSAEHLFKLVTAFELIGMGLPAQAATQIVEKNWYDIRGGYGLAQRHLISGFGTGPRVYIRIILRSLHEIQNPRFVNQPDTLVSVLDDEALHHMLHIPARESAYSFLLIRANEITKRVLELAQEQGGVVEGKRCLDLISWLPSRVEPHVHLGGQYWKRHIPHGSTTVGLYYGKDAAAWYVKTVTDSEIFNYDPPDAPDDEQNPMDEIDKEIDLRHQ
jgi:hypothetical protein